MLIVAAVVGLVAIAGAIAAAVSSSGASEKGGIPEEFRTPLGCDSRAERGFCQEQAAVYRACDYGIDPQATPRFGRDPYNGGSMTSWIDGGKAVATTTIDVRAQTMTLRAPYCEVVLPLGEYLDLGNPGPESNLPAALR